MFQIYEQRRTHNIKFVQLHVESKTGVAPAYFIHGLSALDGRVVPCEENDYGAIEASMSDFSPKKVSFTCLITLLTSSNRCSGANL